jgi:hypothetical protein
VVFGTVPASGEQAACDDPRSTAEGHLRLGRQPEFYLTIAVQSECESPIDGINRRFSRPPSKVTECRVFPAGIPADCERRSHGTACSHTAASIPIVHFRVVSNTSFMINYAAVRCSLMAQPAWRQLQESSMVSLASSQYWLQYFVPLATRQLHAGCSHFFVSSCMRKPPLTEIDILLFRLTEFERYGFPTDAIAKICFKRSSHPTPSSASSKRNR